MQGNDVTIRDMQNLCRDTMEYISTVIASGMRLAELRRLCEVYMLSHGADSFWYWDVGAFVFSGNRTAVSVSGFGYTTDDCAIAENDVITIDLSPRRNGIWGDYARTLIDENGKVIRDVKAICSDEWRRGLMTEDVLHQAMRDSVNENTTFEELYFFINGKIEELGYVNLDFLGNLGHSIAMDKSKRIYIEKGNGQKLSGIQAFTFEPHIGLPGSAYGFKKENIYAFRNGELIEL